MIPSLNKTLKGTIGRAAGMTGLYARNFRSKMVVVAFHRVNDQMQEDGITCSSIKFARFCEFFRKYFNVVPLAEQVAACAAGSDLGGTLSITFDDGYRDNAEVAAPILSSLRLPATFFVTTGFIGSDIVPPWDSQLPVQPGWMEWDQVRELASRGFEIGCHSDSHIDLGTADLQVARTDLTVAKQKLREQLGYPVRLFAYPFGGRNNITELTRDLVREAGFLCCVSCCGGVNVAAANPYDLNRIGIAQWFATPDQFGFELLMGRV